MQLYKTIYFKIVSADDEGSWWNLYLHVDDGVKVAEPHVSCGQHRAGTHAIVEPVDIEAYIKGFIQERTMEDCRLEMTLRFSDCRQYYLQQDPYNMPDGMMSYNQNSDKFQWEYGKTLQTLIQAKSNDPAFDANCYLYSRN
jgi:hypothetical protein